MSFVNDEHVVCAEMPVTTNFGEQQPVRLDLDQCVLAPLFAESDRIADLISERNAGLGGNSFGYGPRPQDVEVECGRSCRGRQSPPEDRREVFAWSCRIRVSPETITTRWFRTSCSMRSRCSAIGSDWSYARFGTRLRRLVTSLADFSIRSTAVRE